MSLARVRFVIGGVQKGGTTALSHYLSRLPGICLPKGKEAHVFDAPDFDDAWQPEDIDAKYHAHFPENAGRDVLHGDATPIYMFHPRLVERIARYNPAMRWIVLLRCPVERAYSQYCMERARGDEHWPAWAAFMFEKWRLRGHEDDFSGNSPLRHWSYRARGDYSGQLRTIYQFFPKEQVLVLQSRVLSEHPLQVLEAVCRFLQLPVPDFEEPAFPRVFEGRYLPLRQRPLLRGLLRYLMRKELQAMREICPLA